MVCASGQALAGAKPQAPATRPRPLPLLRQGHRQGRRCGGSRLPGGGPAQPCLAAIAPGRTALTGMRWNERLESGRDPPPLHRGAGGVFRLPLPKLPGQARGAGIAGRVDLFT